MWTYQTAQKELNLIYLLYISLIPKMRFLLECMNERKKVCFRLDLHSFFPIGYCIDVQMYAHMYTV